MFIRAIRGFSKQAKKKSLDWLLEFKNINVFGSNNVVELTVTRKHRQDFTSIFEIVKGDFFKIPLDVINIEAGFVRCDIR